MTAIDFFKGLFKLLHSKLWEYLSENWPKYCQVYKIRYYSNETNWFPLSVYTHNKVVLPKGWKEVSYDSLFNPSGVPIKTLCLASDVSGVSFEN